jgi:hypothetical protein
MFQIVDNQIGVRPAILRFYRPAFVFSGAKITSTLARAFGFRESQIAGLTPIRFHRSLQRPSGIQS